MQQRRGIEEVLQSSVFVVQGGGLCAVEYATQGQGRSKQVVHTADRWTSVEKISEIQSQICGGSCASVG